MNDGLLRTGLGHSEEVEDMDRPSVFLIDVVAEICGITLAMHDGSECLRTPMNAVDTSAFARQIWFILLP